MTKLILSLALFTFSTAYATCEKDLSVDARFRAMRNTTPEQHQAKQVTLLLNDAFSPLLRRLGEEIRSLADEEITMEAAHLPATIIIPNIAAQLDFEKAAGMNARFENDGTVKEFHFPFKSHNREVMDRLARAAEIFYARLEANAPLSEDPTLKASKSLLFKHSFTRSQIQRAMKLGFYTILQAASALTADPVAARTADQVLESVTAPRARGPSLIVMYALMLRPALIGPYGSQFYWQDPLIPQNNGELKFTDAFKEYLKTQRQIFAGQEEHYDYELGHGCPVAHCAPDAEQSSLQDFMDGLMSIYKRVPPTSLGGDDL